MPYFLFCEFLCSSECCPSIISSLGALGLSMSFNVALISAMDSSNLQALGPRMWNWCKCQVGCDSYFGRVLGDLSGK